MILAAALAGAVLISAGHEGRPASCERFPKRTCALGAPGERAWTPVVADEAARVLRAKGVTVYREPADFDGNYDVDAAVFIHFDGNDRLCSTGASIGYHTDADKPAAEAWRKAYAAVFPFTFMPDNFTLNLRNYYGFHQVRAKNGALVLELGEIDCAQQREWLASRLKWEGDFIARFLESRLSERTPSAPAPG